MKLLNVNLAAITVLGIACAGIAGCGGADYNQPLESGYEPAVVGVSQESPGDDAHIPTTSTHGLSSLFEYIPCIPCVVFPQTGKLNVEIEEDFPADVEPIKLRVEIFTAAGEVTLYAWSMTRAQLKLAVRWIDPVDLVGAVGVEMSILNEDGSVTKTDLQLEE